MSEGEGPAVTEEGSGKGAGTVGGEGDVHTSPSLGASAGAGVEGDGGEGDARMATEGEGGGGVVDVWFRMGGWVVRWRKHVGGMSLVSGKNVLAFSRSIPSRYV